MRRDDVPAYQPLLNRATWAGTSPSAAAWPGGGTGCPGPAGRPASRAALPSIGRRTGLPDPRPLPGNALAGARRSWRGCDAAAAGGQLQV